MSDRLPPPPDPPTQAAQTPAEVTQGGATPAPAGLVPPGMFRVDLHCHSEASADCRTPVREFPTRCAARGIAVQAITDHDQIWGAQLLQELCADNPALTVIVGEEISTRDGEIIGLFLRERVPPGLSAEETVANIRAQGGLVLIPHAFDPLKRFHIHPQALEHIADQVDIVETFNSHISSPRWNLRALEWAESRGKLKSAGSDAHTLDRIGAAWVQAPARDVRTPDDLRQTLLEGTVMGEWKHPFVAYASKLWDFVRRAGSGRTLEAPRP
ncbi:MAG: PHP domain-containing protein [Meiothermus sp.]|nr:PHP domain-containing protein [Meiothermus sp.]